VSNAIKFTDDGGRVEFVVSPADGVRFQLQVTDTGIGIKAEDMPRLFREFEQLESGTARRYEGSGLSLALTKKLVELQHGTITVTSAPAQGSIFTVRLPLSILDSTPQTKSLSEGPAATEARLTSYQRRPMNFPSSPPGLPQRRASPTESEQTQRRARKPSGDQTQR